MTITGSKTEQKYKVSIISPIHVGGIHSLYSNLHFRYVEPDTLIYGTEPHVGEISLPQPADELPESILPWDTDDAAPLYTIKGKLYGNKIDLFSHDAWGNPVIPGNSIKGFFNSAQSFSRLSETAENDSQTHTNKAHHLPVQFHDIPFSKTAMELSDIKLFNLTSEKKFGWKKFGYNPTSLSSPQMATSHYLETLKAGEFSIGTIAFCADSDETSALNNLERMFNTYSAKIAESEKHFYGACSMKELEQFYISLAAKIGAARNGFYVCIGKGAGWNNTVGQLYTPATAEKLRMKHNLGKIVSKCPSENCGTILKIDRFNPHKLFCMSCKKSFSRESVKPTFFPVFPKTRKIVVQDNTLFFPLAWLKFERTENYSLSTDAQTHTVSVTLRERKSKIIRTPFLTPEEYPAEKGKSSHFKKKIKIPDRGNFPTEFNMFLKQIAQLEFILSIKGDAISDTITTLQLIQNEPIDEIILDFSQEEKGIQLTIKIGAVNQAQKNFTINRIWEIIDSFQQAKKSDE